MWLVCGFIRIQFTSFQRSPSLSGCTGKDHVYLAQIYKNNTYGEWFIAVMLFCNFFRMSSMLIYLYSFFWDNWLIHCYSIVVINFKMRYLKLIIESVSCIHLSEVIEK